MKLKMDKDSGIPDYIIDTSLKQLDSIGAVFITVDIDDKTNLATFKSDDSSVSMAINALNASIRNKLGGQISKILFNTGNSESLNYSMLSYAIKDADLLSSAKVENLTSHLSNVIGAEEINKIINRAKEAVGIDATDDSVSYSYKYVENQGNKTSALLLYKEVGDEDTGFTFSNYCANLWYDKMSHPSNSISEIKRDSGISYTINREDLLDFMQMVVDSETLHELKELDGEKFVLSVASLLKQEALGQVTAYNAINDKADMLKVTDLSILEEVPEATLNIDGFEDTEDNDIAKTILYYTAESLEKRFTA
jgi:hypothetical protein